MAALGAAMEDNMTFIPLSWYSGWAIPEFDSGLALELGTNYCIEAMNLMEFIRDNGGQTVAVAGFPSDYGLDFAAGVKLAADFYGMDVVFDGAVIPGQDQTEVITGIVGSGADWTLVAVNAPILAELMGGAVAAGYQGCGPAHRRATTSNCSTVRRPAHPTRSTTSRRYTCRGQRCSGHGRHDDRNGCRLPRPLRRMPSSSVGTRGSP